MKVISGEKLKNLEEQGGKKGECKVLIKSCSKFIIWLKYLNHAKARDEKIVASG